MEGLAHVARRVRLVLHGGHGGGRQVGGRLERVFHYLHSWFSTHPSELPAHSEAHQRQHAQRHDAPLRASFGRHANLHPRHAVLVEEPFLETGLSAALREQRRVHEVAHLNAVVCGYALERHAEGGAVLAEAHLRMLEVAEAVNVRVVGLRHGARGGDRELVAAYGWVFGLEDDPVPLHHVGVVVDGAVEPVVEAHAPFGDALRVAHHEFGAAGAGLAVGGAGWAGSERAAALEQGNALTGLELHADEGLTEVFVGPEGAGVVDDDAAVGADLHVLHDVAPLVRLRCGAGDEEREQHYDELPREPRDRAPRSGAAELCGHAGPTGRRVRRWRRRSPSRREGRRRP